jgi:hypothetical protein
MLGAISLSNSSHFPLMAYSNAVKPVALPPGAALVLAPLRRDPLSMAGGKLIPRFPIAWVLIKPVE